MYLNYSCSLNPGHVKNGSTPKCAFQEGTGMKSGVVMVLGMTYAWASFSHIYDGIIIWS